MFDNSPIKIHTEIDLHESGDLQFAIHHVGLMSGSLLYTCFSTTTTMTATANTKQDLACRFGLCLALSTVVVSAATAKATAAASVWQSKSTQRDRAQAVTEILCALLPPTAPPPPPPLAKIQAKLKIALQRSAQDPAFCQPRDGLLFFSQI